MSIIQFVIHLNLLVGSEQVNKLTKYIKQIMRLKYTANCVCGFKWMQCALLCMCTGNYCGIESERNK